MLRACGFGLWPRGSCYTLTAWLHPRSLHFALTAQTLPSRAVAACWQRGGGGGGKHRISSVMVVGMAKAAAATAVLPPCAAAVALKTPTATVIAGAQTTINNQLKAATAMATKIAAMITKTMTMEMKAKAVAAGARQQHGGGRQLGGGVSSLSRAQHWRQQPAWRWRRQVRRGFHCHYSLCLQYWCSSLTKIMGTMKSMPRRGGGECPWHEQSFHRGGIPMRRRSSYVQSPGTGRHGAQVYCFYR